MAEARLMHVVAVKIEIPAALQIFDLSTIATFEDIQAGSRKGLVKEILGVLLQKLPRFAADMSAAPLSTEWRDIDVSFRFELVELLIAHALYFALRTVVCQSKLNESFRNNS